MDSKVQDVLGSFETSSTNAKSLEEKVAAMESKVRSAEQQIVNLNARIHAEQYAIDDLLLETSTLAEQIKSLEFELQAQNESKESLLLDLRNVENHLIEIKEQSFQRKNEHINDMIGIESEHMKARDSIIKEMEAAKLFSTIS